MIIKRYRVGWDNDGDVTFIPDVDGDIVFYSDIKYIINSLTDTVEMVDQPFPTFLTNTSFDTIPKPIGFFKNKEFTPHELKFTGNIYDGIAYVLDYLNAGQQLIQYRGFSTCRVCGCINGSSDMIGPDGKYFFPSGFFHMVLNHKLYPGKEFVSHCREWSTK